MHFSGSYLPTDVEILLDIKNYEEISILEKERIIQTGEKHYSEVLTEEMKFPEEYLLMFSQIFEEKLHQVSDNILSLCKYISTLQNPVLISLARAGTPYGVSAKRNLERYFNKKVSHFSISIIIGKGIDVNALDLITERHGQTATLIFIDGWTGKGTISAELRKSLQAYNPSLNYKLLVLADIAGVADIAATRQDYIIPSSLLNSTVSGLISRTMINTENKKFHGAKYFGNNIINDLSLFYVDRIDQYIKDNNLHESISDVLYCDINKKLEMEKMVDDIIEKYEITSKNYLKPGIGETTRVLIRRNPDFVILNENYQHSLHHIKLLCDMKNVKVYIENNLPISSIGVINKFKS